jgi:hypothetical protein
MITPGTPTATAAPIVSPPAPAPAPAAVAVPSTTPVVESVAQIASPAVTTAVPATGVAPTVDPRAQIDALATQYGFDPATLAGISDPAAAQAAIRFAVEQAANLGLSGLPAPQLGQNPYQSAGQFQQQAPYQPQYAPPVQQQQAPAAPAVVAIDLKALGLEEDDPAAKAIRVLENQIADGGTTAKQVAARLDQIEAQTRAQNVARVQAEAAQIVDTFASPKYGVGTHRTASQKLAVDRLYDLADAIAIGNYNNNRPIPPLGARLAQAKLIDDMGPSAMVPTPYVAPVNAPVLNTVAPQTGPTPVIAANPNAKWSTDPAIRAALNLRD